MEVRGEVCFECLYAFEYGLEGFEYDTREPHREPLDRFIDIEFMTLACSEHDQDDAPYCDCTVEAESYFSYFGCDACSTRLGGDRYAVWLSFDA